ncbi:putative 23S rRNA (adenosine(1067)-2'-O)-methyltransferase [Arabidopsis thaliana]|uniref:tRNA/rRNA methyltransferase SpoU type domain-containing protein n=4 Tax=Arabidopsis TaxID=3701 RepID=A0A178V0A2_ARATH|nr:tRNA/rRNA methyltransferase (SpoU) family protein [Arabidopsis thaliana]KAG7618822.1 tRNA/rRNA methyltransferase SpoU type [Arabidopsis thaliana x Arabidopsis arenosa]KAG7623292.1 tRNA/rRNA methyltransferase SpoU type [Arabidopsis suecica]ABD85155.1 At4g38020 [Arabidopsis thaliana]AEE86864.1 tRNA/rRNA methyltransferase (SpoU) family protein [Arabidopsis thaliana]OAO99739.1 hypothetical protein AXX17_AT4G43330 [Arabidopsis thaliana]|eukprot:NP_195515.2 tRNA/rRNA methyltransferase (SpoU) family protein [Arabidopsis thaliana]
MHCGCVFASQTVSSLLPFEIKTYASKLRASSAQLPRTQIQINPSDDLSIYGSDKSPANRVSLPSHVNSITSTTNPFVKHCLKLRQSSSYRHAHGSVLVVGTIPIREVCMFQTNKQGMTTEIECLLLHEEAKIPQGLESLSIRIVRVSSLVMKKLSGVQSTESVEAIALMRIPSSFTDLKDDKDIITDCNKWFPSAHRVLVLDSIQDPGNLGTLVRSAMAFNWDGAFLLPGCCDPYNDKALRASRGASFQLPIVSGNWNHLKLLENEFQMKLLAGHPATTTQKLKPVSKLSVEFAQSLAEKPLCLILGSEGNGLSEQARKVCVLVSIPMAGDFESLNVSVAGGIFLYMLQNLV